MKRIFAFVLLFCLVVSLLSFGAVASAEETSSPYDLAESFINLYQRRDIRSGGENAAAKALSSYLAARGYAVTTPALRYYGEDGSGSKVAYDYSHVIGFSDRGKGETILLGCYYGGFEPTDSYGVGTGASEGLSVGLLSYLADALSSAPCEYDIAIAFWGGLEIAGDFNVEDCGVDLAKIKLYINFDCVAAGDCDYLYADDLPRSHEKYFRSVIEAAGAEIAAPPAYKKVSALAAGSGAYANTHLGLLGVNRYFLNEDIPCASFLGGAWDYDCGLYRYRGKGDIEGTSLDTLPEIDKMNGGKARTEQRLLSVADVVMTGVTGEGLRPALLKAGKETSGADLDSKLAVYLITFISLAALLAFFLFRIFLPGKDRRERVWQDSFEEKKGNADPYEELRSDDPYEEREDPRREEQNGKDDDIFRF